MATVVEKPKPYFSNKHRRRASKKSRKTVPTPVHSNNSTPHESVPAAVSPYKASPREAMSLPISSSNTSSVGSNRPRKKQERRNGKKTLSVSPGSTDNFNAQSVPAFYSTMDPMYSLWRERYWTLDYPHGIRNIHPTDLIDIGQAGIALCENPKGKVVLGQLWRSEFMRDHHNDYVRGHLGVTHTLKMAISGHPQGSRWFRVDGCNDDPFSFFNFIRMILDALGHGCPGNQKCFVMDANLLDPRDLLTLRAILAAGHCFVLRAPFWPQDSPVNTVFDSINTTQPEVRTIAETCEWHDVLSFVVRSFPNFVAFFKSCGYKAIPK